MSKFYSLQMTSITGDPVDFGQFEGVLSLIVNVASKWGLTPQYAGLRTLHEEHKDERFTVLGFPCNQFGAQEPGTDEEILAFVRDNYDVQFPMFSKIEVNGDGACELYKWLKSERADDAGQPDIKWNFTKFLVDRSGAVVARYAPTTTPEEIGAELSKYL